MPNKLKKWSVTAILALVIILDISIIIFELKRSDDEIKAPIGNTSQQEVIKEQQIYEPLDIVDLPIKQNNEPEENSLILFTGDIDTYQKKEAETIEVNENSSIEQKLALIASGLSKTQFEGLPIKVESIEIIDGKKIAVINLCEKEQEDKKDKPWLHYLNGGSTLSTITGITLEDSFLQRNSD
jgi:hypothetical protein